MDVDEEIYLLQSLIEEFNVSRSVVKKITDKVIERGIENQELISRIVIEVLWTRDEIINKLIEDKSFSYDNLIDKAIKRYELEVGNDIEYYGKTR